MTDTVVMSSHEGKGDDKLKVKFKPPPLDMPDGGDGVEEDMPSKTPTTPGIIVTTPRDEKSGKDKKKIGHRRFDKETGQITYKKVPTSDLMGSIQLGIANSIGSLAGKPSRDLLLQDFEVIDRVSFPEEGSNTTPSHTFGDFRFKTYAPIAFRYFRDLFNIKPEDFLASICAEPMRELSNPGASGSIFYVSNDDQFIIKTIQHKEADFLQKLLPGYYMEVTSKLKSIYDQDSVCENLQQNPRTLLPKFFGLFCFQSLGKNVRLLAMNNLLPSTVKMHQKYDLKGSTYKRCASRNEKAKKSPTLKDLDFVEDHADGIYLEASTYDALMKTISRDCLVLESFKIMDYSLLFGAHNIDAAQRELQAQDSVEGGGGEGDGKVPSTSGGATSLEDVNPTMSANKPDPSWRKVQRQKSMFTTWESIQADALPIDLGEEYPVGGIPARNAKGERLLIFLGVIDILQNYRLFKKMEHTWKSILHDGDTISVHRPSFYAQRFQDFMKSKVFKKIPSLDLPAVKGPHGKFRNLVHSYLALRHSPSRRKSRERKGTGGSADDKHRGSSQQHPEQQSSLTARPDIVPTESRRDYGTGRSSARFQHHYESPYAPKQGLLRQETTEGEMGGSKEVKRVERLFASTTPTTSSNRGSASEEGKPEVVSHSSSPA